MSIKVIKPIKEYIRTFENVEDFNTFYQLHKQEMDNTTTHKLNKMYHIEGYRITRIKNVLMLKKSNDERIDVIQEIETMKKTINEIIAFIKPTEELH